MIGDDKTRRPKNRGVFGRGRGSGADEVMGSTGLALGGVPIGTFRRTLKEREAPPPREVVTAKLLGDPDPNRVVPDIPDEPGSGNAPRPSVNLTFRDLGKEFRL